MSLRINIEEPKECRDCPCSCAVPKINDNNKITSSGNDYYRILCRIDYKEHTPFDEDCALSKDEDCIIKEESNMEKVINLYANAIGEDLHETKYSAIFCYLHGKIQDENGYDKFSFENKDDAYYFHKNGDACHKVNVIMQNGESRECNFYHWVDSLCRLRGLVVLVDDKDANEYAKKKLEEKSLFL